MTNPVSTYRIQFNKSFSFQDFEKSLPYFHELGVGTIYASPILASVPGSTHGYDGVDPESLDPELGTLDELRKLSGKLKELGIGWLQDIVPNHMAFHSENPWLMDVLEKGHQSAFASFFDIAWNSRLFNGKLMVPFLAHDLNEVIRNGALKLEYRDNRFVMDYEGSVFPLNPKSYITLLTFRTENLPESFQQLVEQIREVTDLEEPSFFAERWNEVLLQFASLSRDRQVSKLVDEALADFNNNEELLRRIVDEQTYVLCHWQRTEEKINFRRFFTVNGLICLNMQEDQVFDKYHRLIKELTEEGVFQGLRIDHIDGLFNPVGYLEKLREHAGEEAYIITEKILEKNEDLPETWPIEGTTGYEFLAMVNNLFTNQDAEPVFTNFYKGLTGEEHTIREQLISKKSEILYDHMGGELENLCQLFKQLGLADQSEMDQLPGEELKKAIGEFLIHLPVYRFYGNAMPLQEAEAAAVSDVLEEVKHFHADLTAGATLLREVLVTRPGDEGDDYRARAAEFYQRCMQLSGPLMAKGGEDTLMYTNNRFVGHNEVGDFPDRFGVTSKAFHTFMHKRQKQWPLALNATSTHDTKRGEDVRARLNVLTDLGERWIEKVEEWKQINAGIPGKPSENDEYLIYQTLVGAYPIQAEDEANFAERLTAYFQKALREAKTNTTWAEPNEAYERDVADFVTNLLDASKPFLGNFKAFLDELADYGVINSLSQVILKFTCPGIPDVYQGCELWDFSLVDPDNRRPVDLVKRQQFLQELENDEPGGLPEALWEQRFSGKIKLWLTRQLLHLRKENPLLFTKGDYIPLKTRGEYKDHLLAFARAQKKTYYITVVPLHVAEMCQKQGKTFFELDWTDTSIVLPDNLLPNWELVCTAEQAEFQGKLVPGELFKRLPFAILKGSKMENPRAAGVLLHITSLASPFGIGDLGPEAFAFADFLAKGNQKMWQILPLNPTEESQANSPYSALSSRAGNPLLISPDLLGSEGLLPADILADYHVEPTAVTDFAKAGATKDDLLQKAFENRSKQAERQSEFEAFCSHNAEWLDDFALYTVLKKDHNGAPWYEWPEPLKLRDAGELRRVMDSEAEQLEYIRWQQFVFDQQWKGLRSYCNDLGIRLIGDMPFYVSYDSADVWANQALFCIDGDGKLTGIAGVPPDAFSDDGQLWGMPVFNWQALKAQGYQWWIDRLAKNVELFDIIRLDHFRAFADYWEVPGGEKTAVNGTWKLGPGEEFFQKVESALGHLPFIAEDLGETSPAVYKLRDQFALPGMKVLQFAFDENMPQSEHIPHNYAVNFIAYTGTHDNNTVKGWYRQTADDDVREQVEKYLGQAIGEETICSEMARLVYASVAKTAILPMQDVLCLDESAKMNSPGSNENNWAWRLLPGQVAPEHEQFLSDLTVLFNRD
jgi:malto-oligosyltrehalose synthase/4-alpha-glucanotransferase